MNPKEYDQSEGQGSEIFVSYFNRIQERMNRTAHEKGWYESEVDRILNGSNDLTDSAVTELQSIEDARRIALMHSELSEGLEGLRHGNPSSDHIPEFSAIEEELADCIIRIMDFSQERGHRVAEALIAKAQFNLTRPHRHGKKF